MEDLVSVLKNAGYDVIEGVEDIREKIFELRISFIVLSLKFILEKPNRFFASIFASTIVKSLGLMIK